MLTPEQEAAHALGYGISRTDLKPEVQAAPHFVALVRAGARFERGRLIEREPADSDSGLPGTRSAVGPQGGPAMAREI